jgi:alpha-galactosidase
MKTTAAEQELSREWATRHLLGTLPFFSFLYGGTSSTVLIPEWRRRSERRVLDCQRTQHEVSYTDRGTGLRVRCVAVVYGDFPVVEWTVYLKNTSRRNTPIIENLKALDVEISRATVGPKPPRLHYNIGSPTKAEDYAPMVSDLEPGKPKRVATSGGRACNAHMPFFNLEGADGGLIVAIGWGGQWASAFECDRAGHTRVTVGQEQTHFTLHPGEEVRTPLIALLFYRGDRVRSQNVWRRWMLAHNVPRPNGKLPAPMLCGMAWLYFAPWGQANAQAMKVFIDTYEARQLPIDAWWIDAGWYNCDASLPVSGYSTWNYTGTWEVDRRRFPNGVREVNDHAHKKGLKTILWFEPGRVTPRTWLAEKHPEWLIAPPPNPGDQFYDKDAYLLNLGNPVALRWLINRIDRILTSEHVDIYREDFNMDPLLHWRSQDAPDRQGITEIRYVTGQIALWDELRRRHPDLLIDNVASGSKRTELEGFRRAVNLWRSDYVAGLSMDEAASTARIAANQCMTHGLAPWIPYFGSAVNAIDTYRFRSFMSPSLGFDFDPRRDDLNYDLWRRLLDQFKTVSEHFFGDFYPLTPYSQQNDIWMAWQFHSPEKGAGMVQAFRREACGEKQVCLKLGGLRADATYEVTDLDGGKPFRLSGRTLMGKGLKVEAGTPSSALILTYKTCAA